MIIAEIKRDHTKIIEWDLNQYQTLRAFRSRASLELSLGNVCDLAKSKPDSHLVMVRNGKIIKRLPLKGGATNKTA